MRLSSEGLLTAASGPESLALNARDRLPECAGSARHLHRAVWPVLTTANGDIKPGIRHNLPRPRPPACPSLAYRPLPDEGFSEATDVRPYGEYVVLFRSNGPGAESCCGLFNLGDMRLELPVEYSCIYPSRESIWVVSCNRRSSGEASFAMI